MSGGYQVAADFNAMGYQCFVLLNRTNRNPWTGMEDGLDQVSGSMDAFLCIYGPRMNHDSFDYERAVYPPVFHALGLLDFNMDNINKLYPELVSHGITVEIHTFSGVPHGQAGSRLMDGYVKYPNFETWETLADQFIMNNLK